MLNVSEQDKKIQLNNGQNITENGNILKLSQGIIVKQTYSSTSIQQHQILDLKKLMSHKRDQAPKTERIKKTIPTLNLNMIGTINQSASATTRNNSFTPSLAYAQLLTPKPNSNSQWKSQIPNNIPLKEKNSQQ
ncbi:hypothetical protein FGO68_gene638 [Halteria grandinella]|uniref:Uncharacterized protein n=1 Tax=Halteria grandinella TaxID=5974 RepID=A0A8J8SXE0_HALGN|nr:hypothetical protein FGO68_gene638 [Halteria grandinella]